MDVTVDEHDLRRLLIEAGLPPDATPMTTAQVWQILDAEAERFLLLRLVAGHGYPLEEAKQKIKAAISCKATVLDKLKAS